MPAHSSLAFLAQFFDHVIEWLERSIGIPLQAQEKLFTSAVIIAVLWLLRILLLKLVWRKTKDIRIRYQWQKGVSYTAAGVALLIVGRIWFEGFDSITTYLGLLSAGLAIALKDVLTDLAGWVFLMWRRPFEVGDRIQIGSHAGDVIDIRIFQFTLNEIGNWVASDQSTGRVIHIPNGIVFTAPQINYTKGFSYIWDELTVNLTFESDWRKAKVILQRIVEQHADILTEHAQAGILEASKQFMIFYTTLSPTVYTSVKDRGVSLTLRYLVEPRRRRGRQQVLWEAILDAFATEADITFAYPTTRYYSGPESSTPAT